jgi:hypothetical protein
MLFNKDKNRFGSLIEDERQKYFLAENKSAL